MNPPTKGHEAMMRHMLNEARRLNADPFIVVTMTKNAKKNPLNINTKLRYLNAMFPNIKKIASMNPVPVINNLAKKGTVRSS